MTNKALIAKLKKDKARLMKLEATQISAENMRIKAKREEIKLKREVRQLKIRTNKKLSRLHKAATNPVTKERINKTAKTTKKIFNKFRDFADKIN